MMTKEEAKVLIEELYYRNLKNMYAMIRKDFACGPIAEDIVQEVFLEAMAHWERLVKHENPDAWIFETTRYKMISTKRKLYARSLNECSDEVLEFERFRADYGLVEMDHVLDSILKEHEKKMLMMYYTGGYSASEMAEIEGITENNFKVKMLRIREKIQAELGVRSAKKKKKKEKGADDADRN